jgi:uncharacterized protein DUF4252
MKTAWILFAAAIPAFAQQNFDFKLLDKMGANAKESTNITLDGNTLKMAGSLLGDGNDSAKSVVKNLKGVYIRSFEFDKPGQYDPADLAPLRAYLNTPQWSKIVDVKDSGEDSQIYLQAATGNQLGGLVIISAEPKEVTVVFISGSLNLSDIGKLSGTLGIPDIKLEHGGKKSDDSKKDDSKKD